MSYSNQLVEVVIGARASLASTGVKGSWTPGLTPVKVRAVAIVNDNAIGDAAIVHARYGTAGLATTAGTLIAAITLPLALAAGKVVYKKDLDVLVSPGQEIIFDVSDAGAAGDIGTMVLLVEPVWERPGNNTSMQATT